MRSNKSPRYYFVIGLFSFCALTQITGTIVSGPSRPKILLETLWHLRNLFGTAGDFAFFTPASFWTNRLLDVRISTTQSGQAVDRPLSELVSSSTYPRLIGLRTAWTAADSNHESLQPAAEKIANYVFLKTPGLEDVTVAFVDYQLPALGIAGEAQTHIVFEKKFSRGHL